VFKIITGGGRRRHWRCRRESQDRQGNARRSRQHFRRRPGATALCPICCTAGADWCWKAAASRSAPNRAGVTRDRKQPVALSHRSPIAAW